MKKLFLTFIFSVCAALSASAAEPSYFSVDNMNGFILHTYASDDPLGDVSFIIETQNQLVLLEPQAFHKNTKELLNYCNSLKKPLKNILVSFHIAGLKMYQASQKMIASDTENYYKDSAGKGMLDYFGKQYQGQIDVSLVPFDRVLARDTVFTIDGVTYTFMPSAMPGVPGVNIDIDGKVLFQHFAPLAGTHPSPFYIDSKEAINAALSDLETAQKKQYQLYIGSHLPGKGTATDLNFQIGYLKRMQDIVRIAGGTNEFIEKMQKAYPDLAHVDNLEAIAEKLYK